MRPTSGLTSLDLAFNPLGGAAVEALRDACSRNRVLGSLVLAGANVEAAQLAAVAMALTPIGKAPPSGTRLFEHGIHTEATHKAMLLEQRAVADPDAHDSGDADGAALPLPLTGQLRSPSLLRVT